MNTSERSFQNNTSRSRPGLLLWIVPYLLFATCGDLLHSPSCPHRVLLHWLGQRTHGAHAGVPHGAIAPDTDDCPACLWSGHGHGQVAARPMRLAFARADECRFADFRGVPLLTSLRLRGSRGPPSFLG